MTPEERDARTVFCMQLAARIRPRDLEEFFSSVGKVYDLSTRIYVSFNNVCQINTYDISCTVKHFLCFMLHKFEQNNKASRTTMRIFEKRRDFMSCSELLIVTETLPFKTCRVAVSFSFNKLYSFNHVRSFCRCEMFDLLQITRLDDLRAFLT